MSLTNPQFLWHGGSFFLGYLPVFNVVVGLRAMRLFSKTKSKFYLVLGGIAFGWAIDIVVFFLSLRPETPPEQYVSMIRAVMAMELVLGSSFIVLNASRLFKLKKSANRPVIHKILLGLAAFDWISCVSNGCFLLAIDLSGPLSSISLAWFSAGTLFDAVLNLAISLAFVAHLRELSNGPAGSATGGLRQGLASRLKRVQVELIIECILIIGANFFYSYNAMIDPHYGLSYTALVIRLHIYCKFLESLNAIMRRGNVTSRSPSLNQPAPGSGTGSRPHHKSGAATTDTLISSAAAAAVKSPSSRHLLAVADAGGPLSTVQWIDRACADRDMGGGEDTRAS